MRHDRLNVLTKYLGSEEKAERVDHLRRWLTPTGFEQYITDFFMRPEYGFYALRNGWFNDRWIDVKAARTNPDGTKTYLIVQCKQWSSYHITESDLTKFYGRVVNVAQRYDCKIIFIATTWYTINAKRFCNEVGIDYVDYRGLLDFDKEYPVEQWISDIRNHHDFHKFISLDYFQDSRNIEWMKRLEIPIAEANKKQLWSITIILIAAGILFCLFILLN